MSETKVEVEFNEIRLQTNPSREFTSTNLYQFIYSDECILTCHGLPCLPNTFSLSLSYYVFLVPLPSVTPGRFAHRLLTYRWTVLAFSRDFHTFP